MKNIIKTKKMKKEFSKQEKIKQKSEKPKK
jgi:hypothetical protein